MQFKDWGEEKFIQHLAAHFPSKGPILGIGDDCAVIPGDGEKAWLVTTDALVEGIHFLTAQISPKDLGYKTIAVNVSDITAMGGEPAYAFLSIALPKTIACDWVDSLIQGIKEACEKWNLLLLGGDTVGSKRDLFLNLTLIGSANAATIKYRHQAEPGDVISVSGFLGDSGGGFKALQEQIPLTEEVAHLLCAHFRPEPHPDQGKWLAEQKGVHAMMDLSDGLNCDLSRLLKRSKAGAIVETSQLPLSPPLAKVSQEQGWDPLQLALTGGEDYCLLLTLSADAADSIQRSFQEAFGSPLYAIGRITNHPDELIYHQSGAAKQLSYTHFDHFQ